jgi:hypothetical protein
LPSARPRRMLYQPRVDLKWAAGTTRGQNGHSGQLPDLRVKCRVRPRTSAPVISSRINRGDVERVGRGSDSIDWAAGAREDPHLRPSRSGFEVQPNR